MNSPKGGPMKLRLTFALVAAALTCIALGGGASANRGHHGQLFSFAGELLAAPGPNAGSVSVQVETGNRPALHALIGQSQNQVFAIGSGTSVLLWSHGVPHTASTADLKQGDYVTLRIRAAGGSTLQQIENTAAASVADHAAPGRARPLWLFAGTVAGPQAGGHIGLHVTSGNWKALNAMLGQPLDQSFAYD